jgi:hypothetical protein
MGAISRWRRDDGQPGVVREMPTAIAWVGELLGLAESSAFAGYDSGRPVLVSLDTDWPASSAWPMRRFMGDLDFLRSPDIPRMRGRVLLPAKDPHVLRKTLVGRSCENVPISSTTTRVHCRRHTNADLFVTERTESVEVEFWLAAGNTKAKDLPTPSPWPQPAIAFRDAELALNNDAAELIIHAVPSGTKLLSVAGDVQNQDRDILEQKARMVLGSVARWVSELASFLPERGEVELVRLALRPGPPASLVADAQLSPLGVLALSTWRREGHVASGRTALSSQPATMVCSEDRDPRVEPPGPFAYLSDASVLSALAQAPFLLTESVKSCLPAEQRDPRSIARALGDRLGLGDVEFSVEQADSLQIVARLNTLGRSIHARVDVETASRLRVEIRADSSTFPAARRPMGAGVQSARAQAVDASQMAGVLCMETGFRHLRSLLAHLAWRHQDRQREDAIVARESVAAQTAFDCAASFAHTRQVGREWSTAMSQLSADLAHAEFALERQLRELRRGCEKEDSHACAQIPRIERLAGIVLPKARCPCAPPVIAESPVNTLTSEPEPLWWPIIVRGMARDGKVESRSEAGIVPYADKNRLAIDARTPLRKVQAYLERDRNNARDQRNLAQFGWFRGLARDEDGQVIVLPGLGYPEEMVNCRGRTLVYRFTKAADGLKRSIEDLTKDCQFAQNTSILTNILLEFPDETTWGEAVGTICDTACMAESGLVPNTKMRMQPKVVRSGPLSLYLGPSPTKQTRR